MNVNDNINMEYEARVMINQNQYSLIMKSYESRGHKLTNTNYYFDDENKSLTMKGFVLRVRNVDEQHYELTLKIKGENGDKEINYSLTSIEAKDMIEKCEFSAPSIEHELELIKFNKASLKLITTLKTERLEISEDSYLLVIDKNFYNGKVDYNLEVESASKPLAIRYLSEICSNFNIENKKDYISKSRRAIYNL